MSLQSNRTERGFWDGGRRGHGTAKESGGKSSGFPGVRRISKVGIQTDFDEAPRRSPPGSEGPAPGDSKSAGND